MNSNEGEQSGGHGDGVAPELSLASISSYADGRPIVLTVGYGNRGFPAFIELVKQYGVTHLVDVRSVPQSSYWEDFRRQNLERLVPETGLKYVYMGDTLGGVRGSATLCREPGVVDIRPLAETAEFQLGLQRLGEAVKKPGRRLALMCGCMRPNACHRARLVAPAIEKQGIAVVHIDAKGRLVPHCELVPEMGIQGDLFRDA